MTLETLFQLSLDFIRRVELSYERHPININLKKSKKPILIIGQKGVGKTTFILQDLTKKLKDTYSLTEILYIPCDHYRFKGLSLFETAEEFVLHGGKCLYLDEIHHYQEWSQELKSIIDSFPELHLVATGSSLIEVQKGSHDLSRRMLVYEMYGLSFREYLELELGLKFEIFKINEILSNHSEISLEIVNKLEQKNKKVLPVFKAYIKNGFYPYYKKFTDVEFYMTLQQNIERTLDTDLLSINQNLTGNATRKIKRLLVRLSDTVPFMLEIKSLAKSLNIGDERTLHDYLTYLEKSRLIKIIYGKGSFSTEMNKPERIYLDNTNLSYALLDRNEVSIGTLRETFFLSSLMPVVSLLSSEKVDFIVDDKYIFEIGGKKKNFNQIKNIPNSYLALDEIEVSSGNKIPLWLFGFMY